MCAFSPFSPVGRSQTQGVQQGGNGPQARPADSTATTVPLVDSQAASAAVASTAADSTGAAAPRQGSALVSAALAFETLSLEKLPKPLQEPYPALQSRLKSNPNLEYIELDRKNSRQGLCQFLSQFKQELETNPELAPVLAQLQSHPAGRSLLQALEAAASGKLDSEAVLKLQTFIVASGEDISHPGSRSGLDGAYGPRTHQGLQNAFVKLLQRPQDAVQQLNQNISATQADADDQRDDFNDMGGGYVSGMTPEATDADLPFLPPATTSTGQSFVDAANATSDTMATRLARYQKEYKRKVYRCYEGVKLALNQLQPPISLTGGSAYLAADQLRSKYADRFSKIVEMPANSAETVALLKNLPKGAIVVWDRSPDPALRKKYPNKGYNHGHISIAMGGGREYSDRYRNQITAPNPPSRYAGCTIFYPK